MLWNCIMCPQCVKMYGVEYLLKKRFLRTCILEDQFLIVNIFSFHGILQALKCPLLHKYLKSVLENSHSMVMTVCLYRSSEGCPEYNQRLLWRPGPQSPHCSPQSHGRTPLTPALIVKISQTNQHNTHVICVLFPAAVAWERNEDSWDHLWAGNRNVDLYWNLSKHWKSWSSVEFYCGCCEGQW